MELAKIRNKSLREAQSDQGIGTSAEGAAGNAAQPVTAHTPPALTYSAEGAFHIPETVSFPGPAPVRHTPQPTVKFDPLELILAGRASASALTTDLEVIPDSPDPATDLEMIADYEELLCFRLANEEYGVNIMEIKEIIKPRELTEIPRAPEFVSGVISLRGMIVPVINMRKRLGMPGEALASRTRIIIVKTSEGFSGLHVDEVTGVVKIASSAIEPPPPVLNGIDRDFVSCIGRVENRMIIALETSNVTNIAFGNEA
jgi:purine-binding chemotaxis protein CheW